jgi:hypothetical protein
MDDALLVRRFQRFRDLPGDWQRLVDRDQPLGNAVGEGGALDELHHQRLPARRVFEPVDGGDVWVIQRGEHFGFALKARQPVGVSGQRGREDLDGNLALQLRVRRPVNLPHAARAERPEDVVGAEARAIGQGHERGDSSGGALWREKGAS